MSRDWGLGIFWFISQGGARDVLKASDTGHKTGGSKQGSNTVVQYTFTLTDNVFFFLNKKSD
jgi:hypothetical protein